MTLDQYLTFEAASPVAHEYRDGCAVALAVPSRNHARIAMNLSVLLGAAARAAGCDAYAGDVKVVTARGERLIPDFVVTCDGRDMGLAGESGEAVIAHPWLVVEILSPTSVADDLSVKMDAYMTIADVRTYLVVDSRRRALRAYERMSDGKFSVNASMTALSLRPRLPCDLTIEEIYRDTTVPHLENAPPTV